MGEGKGGDEKAGQRGFAMSNNLHGEKNISQNQEGG